MRAGAGDAFRCVLGLALAWGGVVLFCVCMHMIVTYPGQDMPGMQLLGAFVIAPIAFIAGVMLHQRSRMSVFDLLGFSRGSTSSVTSSAHRAVRKDKRLRNLVIALVLNSAISFALMATLGNLLALLVTLLLVPASVCALVRHWREEAFVKTCLIITFVMTVGFVVLLSALPSANVRYTLVVNGIRTLPMTAAMGDVLGFIMILCVVPLLLAIPIGLLSGAIYNVCSLERV